MAFSIIENYKTTIFFGTFIKAPITPVTEIIINENKNESI